MGKVRKAEFSGKFYPKEKEALLSELSLCFSNATFGPGGSEAENAQVCGGVVPHAGYCYSGPCAASFFSILPRNLFRTIVILGTNHTGNGASRLSIAPWGEWETPLGKIPVNTSLADRLSESGLFRQESAPHLGEHSIEVLLPFLQSRLEKFSILPVTVSSGDLGLLKKAGAVLAQSIEPKRTLLVASSDMNHYEGLKDTLRKDSLAIRELLRISPEGLIGAVSSNRISMCGVLPSALFLFALLEMGVARAELLKHYSSEEILPSERGTGVGYASVSFLRK